MDRALITKVEEDGGEISLAERVSAPPNEAGALTLRDVMRADLPLFFAHQQDAAANHMAAFTAKDPANWNAFLEHWTRILDNEANTVQTIVHDGTVIGYVTSFPEMGRREVSYWLDRAYWGQGLATKALAEFLRQFTMRPLFARAVKDHAASLRVLAKCGFVIVGEDSGFANARGQEVEEFILELRADAGSSGMSL